MKSSRVERLNCFAFRNHVEKRAAANGLVPNGLLFLCQMKIPKSLVRALLSRDTFVVCGAKFFCTLRSQTCSIFSKSLERKNDCKRFGGTLKQLPFRKQKSISSNAEKKEKNLKVRCGGWLSATSEKNLNSFLTKNARYVTTFYKD